MIELRFHANVEQEVDNAYFWYESQVPGLGEDFLHELDNGLVSIQTMPKAWARVAPGFRRYLLQKFPYGIIYQLNQQSIVVIAVMHMNRKPGYWKNRRG